VPFPHQSMRPPWRLPGLSRSRRYAHSVPKMPTGTLTQNTSRQSTVASSPPATRPMNMPDRPDTWFMPSANPRLERGNASVRMAAELAVSMEPPRAWITRQPISHWAPLAPVNGQSDSRMEDTVKTTKPAL
jgi:hypothetical protein